MLAFSLAQLACPGSGSRNTLGAGTGGRAVASGPGYQSSMAADSPAANTAPWVTAAIAGAARASVTLVADGLLADVARTVAQSVATHAQHRPPSARTIQRIAWAAGVMDPTPALSLVTSQGDIPASSVADAIARDVVGGGYNRVAVGLAQGSDGTRVVAVLLSQRRVTLSALVPRRANVGERVLLRGTMAEGLRSPELALTDAEGHIDRTPLGDGPDFFTQFPVRSSGTWQVELLAVAASGVTVIANFPLYVGVDPPSPTVEVAQVSNEQPAQVVDALMQRINEVRLAAHRPALTLMPNLADVARAHSEAMATTRTFAHNSQDGRTPGDRIRAAGIQSGVILENIGRGSGSEEIHQGLMESPGHRANIENARVTHVGIGAVRDPSVAGGFIVTQDFVEVAATVNVAQAPDRVLERINSVRQRRGVNPVVARPQLMEVASRAAQAFFSPSAPTQQRVVEQANREASRAGLVFRRIEVLATIVPSVEDATGLEPLFNYEVAGMGIGISQGSRPGMPPNSIFVIYVLGYPR